MQAVLSAARRGARQQRPPVRPPVWRSVRRLRGTGYAPSCGRGAEISPTIRSRGR